MLENCSKNKNLPFWLITFGFMVALTLPKLIQDGMFLDAMLYTSVSHNMSMGIGTFWFPQFSTTYHNAGLSSFHEHPPLVFAIQSLFFKIFGDSMYVERFYTFLTMCITAFLIKILWNEINKNDETLKKTGWLPLFLWITIPVCFWSYSNNMQENTMGIFTLSAVILIYRSVQSQKNGIISLLFSGFLIFLATMCKGLPGVFPIAVPVLYWIITRKTTFNKSLLNTLLIIIIPLVAYLILFNIPESRESLSFYLFKRVLNRINQDPTVGNRFFILYRLLMELLPQIILALVIIIFAKIRKAKIMITGNIPLSVFFISIGFSASVPLMLTLVQKGFYFVPSLPFFAIGLSVLIAPTILNFEEKINTNNRKYKVFLALSILLFAGAVGYSFMQKGKTARDRDMLADVYSIGRVVPKFTEVTIPTEMFSEYVLGCYFIRYFNISLKPEVEDKFYMIRKTMSLDSLPEYRKVNIETKIYDLYQRK
jgi:4-amino-4-deoxy-L-arabinose transferase-like glycosyltransferase